MSQTFSTDDVATHNSPDSLWFIIDRSVFDVTKFQKDHPGGKKILQKFAGKDVSKQFRKYHTEAESILLKYKNGLELGGLEVEGEIEFAPILEPGLEVAQPVKVIA